MTEMTPDELDTFLRETRIAKLAYLQASGAPTIVPVWFEWDGSAARVFTSRNSPKMRRLTADPRVALSVELIGRLANRYDTPEKAAEVVDVWPAGSVVLTITPGRIRSGG